MVRDVLVREIPAILQRDLNATTAMAGAIVLLGLNYLGFSQVIQIGGCVITTSGQRFTAMIFGINLPAAKRAE